MDIWPPGGAGARRKRAAHARGASARRKLYGASCTARAGGAMLHRMYAFHVAVEINGTPRRIWRALCDPAEVVQWDTGVATAIDAPVNYPQPGQYVRWRYRNGPFHILHDRPQAVVPEHTLRSLLTVGPFRFDETYTLEPRNGGCRLTAALQVVVPFPVVGRLIERWYLGPRTRDAVRASLGAIKHHCEARR